MMSNNRAHPTHSPPHGGLFFLDRHARNSFTANATVAGQVSIFHLCSEGFRLAQEWKATTC